MNYINNVVLQGTIVSIRRSARGSSIQIATDGGSKRGRGRAQTERSDSDFPVIDFPRSVDISDFNIRDMVRITAKSGVRFERSGDRNRYVVALDGIKIDKAERLLARYNRDLAGTEGGRADDANIVVVRGEVRNIFVPESRSGLVILTIRTEEGDQVRQSRVTCYQRQANTAKELHEGDEVMIAGAVRTFDNRDSYGHTEMWILVRDIAVLTVGEKPEE